MHREKGTTTGMRLYERAKLLLALRKKHGPWFMLLGFRRGARSGRPPPADDDGARAFDEESD